MDLPLLVTRDLVALPGALIPIDVLRPASIAAVDAAQQGDGRLVLALEEGDGVVGIGTLAELVKVTRLPGGRTRVMLRTLAGVRIDGVDCGYATIAVLANGPEASPAEREALCARMVTYVQRHPGLDDQAAALFADPAVPSLLLTGLVGQLAFFPVPTLQALLASPVALRLRWMTELLDERIGELVTAEVPPMPAPEDDFGPVPDDVHDGMPWTARLYVRSGLLDTDAIEAVVADAWRGAWVRAHGTTDGLHRAARDAVALVAEEEAVRAASFGTRTTVERLDAALEALEEEGFVTGLLGTDLADAIATARTMAPDAPYAVFHQDDLIDALQGQGLRIAFGGGDAAAVGRRVVDALRAEGLPVVWDGDIATRIHVAMRWEHRRIEALAA